MKKSLILAIIIAGISSVIAQIILLREAISGFYGNELIIGVILGNWLLIIGIGAYIGKYAKYIKNKITAYILTQLLIIFIAPLTIFLIKIIRNIIAVPGELISILPAFFYSFIIILPFAFIHGFQFTLASLILSEKKEEKAYETSNVYISDSFGDMLGGILFSYILVFIFNSFQAINFVILINILSVFILSISFKKRDLKYISIILAILFIIFLQKIDLQQLSTKAQYKDQNVIFNKNSIYGNLVITETENQLNFYENGFPLFNTQNTFSNEEIVHYAMLQHTNPKEILLISGGVAGTLDEINKYNINNIDYIELDPLIIKAGNEFTDLNLNRTKIYSIDGRLFIKRTRKRYDIVIIDLPDPDSVQINRFYTLNFFNDLKKKLNKDAIISLTLKGADNYLTPELRTLNLAIYNTLKRIFNNTIIIPGTTNYFIASDSPLDYNYKEKLKEKNITTEFIEYYIEGKTAKTRLDYINNAMKGTSRINRDFKPISHFFYLNYWLNQFNLNYNLIITTIVILILFILFLTKIKPIPLTIFITGFSGTSLSLIIIIAFQILYGYVYHQIGIIITTFLAGIVLGSFISNRMIKHKTLSNKTLSFFDFLMVAYSIIMPINLILLSKITSPPLIIISTQIIIPLMTIIIGLLVGIEFPVALKLLLKKEKEVGKTAGLLYLSDLAGACIGAYIITILLIPQLGIIAVSLIIGALNLISGIYLLFKN